MGRRLRRAGNTCENRGMLATCMKNKARTCLLYDNPYMAPGPCSRMAEERADTPASAERNITLIDAICSRGPLIDRFMRYLLRVRWDQAQIAVLNKDLLTYAWNGDAFGVRGALFLGADPDTRDEEGRTPLMRVAELSVIYTMGEVNARLTCAAYLMGYRADRKLRDGRGMTAKDIAGINEFHELADIL